MMHLLTRGGIATLITGMLWITVGCQPADAPAKKNIAILVKNEPSAANATLNNLFEALAREKDAKRMEVIEARIWDVWMESGADEINALMTRGNRALAAKDYTKAIRFFTKITERMPDYAEGWNKRATAYYLHGEYEAAIADIDRTLSLESRHFGALSGLASIYIAVGDYREALAALERLLLIRPNQPKLREQVATLYQKLGMIKT